VSTPTATYVAADESDDILGTYYIKPNQAALGAHVCNCGYIVAPDARNKGVASAMCRHSQAEALALGFRAMQYNLVVSSNEGAVRLWKSHDFELIGTLPEAFRHPQLGYVDAYVMYKIL
jgi:ribosomal protein S18 acetylase RimI-like enzyme